MKAWTPALADHYAGRVTTLADCWKITRQDGTVLGFTSHERDLVVDGVTYVGSASYTPSEANSSAELAVDTMELQSWLAGAGITAPDIEAGLYDGAVVENFEVNYQAPDAGRNIKLTGFLGNPRWTSEGEVVYEVRSLAQKLQQVIGNKTQPTCINRFGDEWCGVDLDALQVAGVVETVHSRTAFTDTTQGEDAGHFDRGLLTFTTGDNAGYSRQVRNFDGARFELLQPFPFAFEAGDQYEARPTCFKRLAEDCRDTYNNVINFRGAPYLPGTDKQYDYPDPPIS